MKTYRKSFMWRRIASAMWLGVLVVMVWGCGASSSEAGVLIGYGRIIPPDPPPEEFTYGVADRALYERLDALGVGEYGLRHIPRCERP